MTKVHRSFNTCTHLVACSYAICSVNNVDSTSGRRKGQANNLPAGQAPVDHSPFETRYRIVSAIVVPWFMTVGLSQEEHGQW